MHRVLAAEPEARVAWLSLDGGDNDPARFLTQLVAGMHAVDATIGSGAKRCSTLHRPRPLNLSVANISALEARTEGWAASLQLAALSLRGNADVPGFIEAFTGSNRFILDYLVEEVLQRQPDGVRNFLMRTALLD